MRYRAGLVALAAGFIAMTAAAGAQPINIRFDRPGGGDVPSVGAGTTVFHGVPAATGTSVVAAGGTTVFHGAPGGNNGLPATTGSSTGAPSPPAGAGR